MKFDFFISLSNGWNSRPCSIGRFSDRLKGMRQKKRPENDVKKSPKWLIFLLIPAALMLSAFFFFRPTISEETVHEEKLQNQLEHRVQISQMIGDTVRGNKFPETADMTWDGQAEKATVHTTIDLNIQKEA